MLEYEVAWRKPQDLLSQSLSRPYFWVQGSPGPVTAGVLCPAPSPPWAHGGQASLGSSLMLQPQQSLRTHQTEPCRALLNWIRVCCPIKIHMDEEDKIIFLKTSSLNSEECIRHTCCCSLVHCEYPFYQLPSPFNDFSFMIFFWDKTMHFRDATDAFSLASDQKIVFPLATSV